MIIRNKFNGYVNGNNRLYPGGGGGPTTTKSETSNIPEYARPYVERMLGSTEKQVYTYGDNGNITGFQPYKPFEGETVAGFSPMQAQAMRGIGGYQLPGQTGLATRMTGAAGMQSMGAGDRYAQEATNPYATQAYMSPYMQNALEPQMREAARQSAMQGQQNQAQAVQSGAFGGSRSALIEAERQRNLGQQQADIYGRGMQTAFEQARQAQQFGSELGLKGYGQGLQAAGQMGALGQQQYGQEMGLLGQQMDVGGKQQAYEQARLNQIVQDYATAQQYPFIQLGTLSNMLRGLPMQASTTQMYQAQPPMLQQAVGLAGAGANLYQSGMFGGGKQAKEGGAIKEMASGGIASGADPYKLPSMMKKLSDDQLQGKLGGDTDPETMGIAQAEKQRRDQIRGGMPKMAGGGVVAFAAGSKDAINREDTEWAEGKSKDVKVAPPKAVKQAAKKEAAPVSEPAPAVSATPYQDQYKAALASFGPPPEFEKARAGIKTLEDRVAAGPEGELDRQQQAYKKLGIDPAKMFEEERARVQEEKKMSREDARKTEYLRYAQMFAKFGSTPGPVLRAVVLSINDTVPDLIDDQAKASAIQREANKVLSDLNKSELLEKQGRASDAIKAHNDAAKTLTQLSTELGTTLYKAEADKLQAASMVAREEIGANARIKAEEIQKSGRIEAEKIQAGSRASSEAKALQREKDRELKARSDIDRAHQLAQKDNYAAYNSAVNAASMAKDEKKKEFQQNRANTLRATIENDRKARFLERGMDPPPGILGGGETPSAQTTSGLKPGDVVDGYKFKGGNPNDKNNWTKE